MPASEARRPTSQAVALGVTAAVAVVGLLVLADNVPPHVVLWTGIATRTMCALGSLGLIWLGWRGALAEVAMTGVVLLTVPLLDLAGVLSEQGFVAAHGGAGAVARAVAVPLAALAGAPLLLPDGRLRAEVARLWRAWTSVWLGTVLLLAFALLWTSLRPTLASAPVVTAAALVGAALFGGIGWRHVSLYRVSRQRVSLLVGGTFVSLGIVGLPTSALGALQSLTLVAMFFDVTLSLIAIAGIAVISRQLENVPAVMAPIVTRDPLVALRLGLDPAVLGFIERVARKDPSTKEHVVRVGELAMRVAVRAGIRGPRLRALGIGALLHDIGKLVVPDDVLRKPGALTDIEYEIIKEHPSAGELLLASSEMLAASARYVRWHHERPDGMGYPDGLKGDEIPLDVAIVSVCDAYDAMTQHRHYRRAMTSEQALAILDEHGGTQFDPVAVQLVRAELRARPQMTTVFASLGNAPIADRRLACDHALPGGHQTHGAR